MYGSVLIGLVTYYYVFAPLNECLERYCRAKFRCLVVRGISLCWAIELQVPNSKP